MEHKGKKTLKKGNLLPLSIALFGNLAIFSFLSGNLSNWNFWEAAQNGAIPAFLVLFSNLVFYELVPAETKARIVFWRWHNPLPGAEAFSKHVYKDARIDAASLRTKIGKFPRSPEKQNSLWYKLYLPLTERLAVMEALQKYLFARDYCVAALLMLFALGIAACFISSDMNLIQAYIGALGCQYMVARHMAETHGVRLVKTVLAINSAE